jgi:hypothetical protein
VTDNIGVIDDTNTVLQIIESITESPIINTNATIGKSKTAFDSIIDFDNASAILTNGESKKASSIYDNLLRYSYTSDCSGEGNFTDEMKTSTPTYIDKINTGLVNDQVAAVSEPEVIVTDSYTLYSHKNTEC